MSTMSTCGGCGEAFDLALPHECNRETRLQRALNVEMADNDRLRVALAAAESDVKRLNAECEMLNNMLLDDREKLAAAEANLATFGMVELAVRNPNVSSYITEWEGRALSAEAKLAEQQRYTESVFNAMRDKLVSQLADERRHADELYAALYERDEVKRSNAVVAHAARRAAEVDRG